MRILLGYTGSSPIEIEVAPIDVQPVIETLDEIARAGGDLTTDVRLSDGRVLWIRSRDLALALVQPADDDPMAAHRVMDGIREGARRRLWPEERPSRDRMPVEPPPASPTPISSGWPPWRREQQP